MDNITETNPSITAENPISFNLKEKRRQLLPLWIKIFCWFFMIAGTIALFGLPLALFGIQFQIVLYGMETQEPLSYIGLFLMFLFLFKGVAAYGLWLGTNWAIGVSKADAVLGIVVCLTMMLVFPFINFFPGIMFQFRLELLLLIPYWKKLNEIDYYWENPE